jgi:hypothetical protein
MEQKRLSLSLRGGAVPLSPIRKLTPLADAAKQRGIRIHHLNIGQPDIRTPQPVIDAYRNFDAKVLAYSPSLGIQPLRESIAAYHLRYGHPVAARRYSSHYPPSATQEMKSSYASRSTPTTLPSPR